MSRRNPPDHRDPRAFDGLRQRLAERDRPRPPLPGRRAWPSHASNSRGDDPARCERCRLDQDQG